MTQPDAATALRELLDDVKELRVTAVDSPAYRDGARAALTAVADLIEHRVRHVAVGAVCGFPGCSRTADPANLMCVRHSAVRVAGSYVDDTHLEGGHG